MLPRRRQVARHRTAAGRLLLFASTAATTLPCSAAAAASLVGLGSEAAGPPRSPPDQLDRTALAGQVELARLLDLAAQRLGLNLQYDSAQLRGTVTLRLPTGLSDTELWTLTNRVLALHGFTTVQMPGEGPLAVVKIGDAAGLARLQRGGVDSPEPTAAMPGFGTVALRPMYRPAKELIEAIKPVLSRTGSSVSELGSTGVIVLSDLAPRLEEALRLLAELDVPGDLPVVEEITARHLPADALAALVAQVAVKRDAVTGHRLAGEVIPLPGGRSVLLIAPAAAVPTWRQLIAQLDQREPVQTVTYSPVAFAPAEVARLIEEVIRPAGGAHAAAVDDRWRLVLDDLTGSLIITATAADHAAVRELLDRLERSSGQEQRPMRSYRVRNRDARELVGVLHGLMDVGVLDAAAAGSPAREPLQPSPPVLSAPDIGRTDQAAVPGIRLPAAITPPATVEPVPAARESSVPRARGRVTLTVDELTNTIIALGEPRVLSQIEQLIRQLDVRQPQVMLEVMLVSLSAGEALSLGVELTKQLDLHGDTRATLASLFGLAARTAEGVPTLGAGTGFSALVLNPGDFSVVVRALETLNEGRAVSMPRVLVNNNQQGTFSSVLQQPIARTDATTASVTTSFGGTADAGTIATVRPQIAAGDHLILDYSVQLSTFVGAAPAANLPPPKQANSVSSVVTIPDGYTVIVGGLELTTEAAAEARVPGVGAIPIIGELFKNRNRNRSRDRFYVFIRANVLRHGGFEDLKYLSSMGGEHAGIDDGWPVVQPRVIR